MRVLAFLTIGLTSLICGCASQAQMRASYVRYTLPNESVVLVKGAERVRRAKPDVTTGTMALIDQIIVEHALRLHICLTDPGIAEKDKAYARKILPTVVEYLKQNCTYYEPGKEYEWEEDDFILPPKMKIRDVLNELIQKSK